MSFFYQDTGFALHLLRHTGLLFLYLGFLYGLQVLRQSRLPRLPAAVLGHVALMALWQGFLFLWTLFLWGPSVLGMAFHHLANLPPAALLLGFWLTPPRPLALRRLLLGHVIGLFWGILGGGLLLLNVSPTLLLKLQYGFLVLLALFALWQTPRRVPTRGRTFAWVTAAGFLLAGLGELFLGNRLMQPGTLLGIAEIGLAPLLLAWPYVWAGMREPARTAGAARAHPNRGAYQDALGPYLQQLDVLLQNQTLQQPWNPVPYMTQAVLTWMYQHLRPQAEPRAHLPLPRIVERVLERHEKDLAQARLQMALHVDAHLSVDPSLGEWLLEMLAAYLLRHASEESVIEVRIQGSQDPKQGPVLYVRVRHALLPRPRGEEPSWMPHALMLGRLLLLDMGGDWWLEEEEDIRTLWLHLPLRGFGRVMAMPSAQTPAKERPSAR